MSRYAFCTVVTRSYLRYAAGLAAQLKRFHPDATLHVLLIDPPGDLRPFAAFPMSLIPLSQLRIPDIEAMKIYFTAFELANVLKPFLVTHLLDGGFQKVIYLDSDIFVVGGFEELLSLLDRANFVLTPHILTPFVDNIHPPTNVMFADAGIYNGGLWGMTQHQNARVALAWLMDALPAAGFHDPGRGRFVDQKLLPMAADLFPAGFEVLRHPGYNIAYWNLKERNVRKVGTQYFAGERPAVFFHLSGYREENADRISVHSDKHTFRTMPVTAAIAADYSGSLPRDACFNASGYAFDWHKGRRLTPALRRYYFEHRTFAGYRRARIGEGMRLIARGLKRFVT